MNKHLIPREHGAAAELGFPLLTGLVLGSPGWASWLFVAAALLLFMANEPLVVLLGDRGKRLQVELAAQARLSLAVLGVLGAATGLFALWLAPPPARVVAVVPAAFAIGLVPLVFSRNLKSLSGEVVAAAAFSSMHLPVAAAGGVTGVLLWGPAAMWFLTTVVATLCVHAIKARITGAAPWVISAAAWAALLSLVAMAATILWIPDWRIIALAASLPLAGVVVINRRALSPKKLKQVGWTVVAANSLAVALLAAGV